MKMIQEKWVIRLFVMLLACAVIQEVSAMFVRSYALPLAWSSDGQSILIEERQSGPEGGGSLAYRLISLHQSIDKTWQVSSDFSDGGSNTHQEVTVAQCQKTVAELQKALLKAEFHDTHVHLDACRSDYRKDLVMVTDGSPESMVSLNNSEHSAVHYEWTPKKLNLFIDKKQVKSVPLDEALSQANPDQCSLYLSANRKGLVVLERGQYGSSLLGLFYAPEGDLKKLRQVPLKQPA